MNVEVLKNDGYGWTRFTMYFGMSVSEAKKHFRAEYPMYDVRDMEFKAI